MDITYVGLTCFRLRGKDATIITDPAARSSGYTLARAAADIVTVSNRASTYINVEAVAGTPKIISGPGEYEVKGVFILGIATPTKEDQRAVAGRNTAYVLEIDGLSICHLGVPYDIPPEEQIERLENLDVLLVPVGGQGSLTAAQAAETVSLLEPKIVIPMYYRTDESPLKLDPVDKFLKEMGVTSVHSEPKLSVTRSSLPEATQVVLLDHRH